jgi:hypothetical protein
VHSDNWVQRVTQEQIHDGRKEEWGGEEIVAQFLRAVGEDVCCKLGEVRGGFMRRKGCQLGRHGARLLRDRSTTWWVLWIRRSCERGGRGGRGHEFWGGEVCDNWGSIAEKGYEGLQEPGPGQQC